MSWKDVSPREKLVWMVQYYIVIVLTTASTFQSHTTSPIKKKPNILKRGKTRVNKSRLVLAWNLIGWKNSAIFLDQSKSEVKHKQSDNDYFRHLQDKCFYGAIFRRSLAIFVIIVSQFCTLAIKSCPRMEIGEELLLAPSLYFINCLEPSSDKGNCC